MPKPRGDIEISSSSSPACYWMTLWPTAVTHTHTQKSRACVLPI